MEKFYVWKILALISIVFFIGCAGPKNQTGTDTRAGSAETEMSGTGNASSGAGTGTGGTETESSGTGDATSGAGTGTGGTEK